MKKTAYLILCLLALVACRDTADIGQIGGESRLVVYAFPTEGDTVSISISQLYPVSGKWQPLEVESVECATGGAPDRIVRLADTVYNGFAIARCLAIGTHRCGDTVSVSVRAKGLPAAWGSTVIPGLPSVEGARLDTAVFRGTPYTVLRTAARYTPSTPYYAVRVEARYSDAYKDEAGPLVGPLSTVFMPLEVEAEPLLAANASADIDLGTSDSDFYRLLYTFSQPSACADGVLHLYISSGYTGVYSAYRAQLLALSAEYNAMLRSANGSLNNTLGKYGLAFAYSTYTNVHGGYGCIGGYAEAWSAWQHSTHSGSLKKMPLRCEGFAPRARRTGSNQ